MILPAYNTVVQNLFYSLSALHDPIMRSQLSQGRLHSAVHHPFMAILNDERGQMMGLKQEDWILSFSWQVRIGQSPLASPDTLRVLKKFELPAP